MKWVNSCLMFWRAIVSWAEQAWTSPSKLQNALKCFKPPDHQYFAQWHIYNDFKRRWIKHCFNLKWKFVLTVQCGDGNIIHSWNLFKNMQDNQHNYIKPWHWNHKGNFTETTVLWVLKQVSAWKRKWTPAMESCVTFF